ncbi:MAG: hypothetical protein AAF387_15245 [Pseudomonadota bacterium]
MTQRSSSRLLSVALLLLGCTVCMAESASLTGETLGLKQDDFSLTGLLLQGAGVAALGIICVFLMVFALKRFSPGNWSQTVSNESQIQHIQSRRISRTLLVHVIKVDDRSYVVAEGETTAITPHLNNGVSDA